MSKSFYKNRINDTDAVYFPESDGTVDVSNEFQNAINQVVEQSGYGILFVPEGTYLFSKTIYIPTGIRVIGYGSIIHIYRQ